MTKIENDCRIILKTAMILCIIPGIACVLGSIASLIGAINMLNQTIPGRSSVQMFVLSGLMLLASMIFFLAVFLRKKKHVLKYYLVLGGFIFLSYMIAAFQSLFRIGTPGMEFVILTFISCLGIWFVLVALNSEIQDYVKVLSESHLTPVQPELDL